MRDEMTPHQRFLRDLIQGLPGQVMHEKLYAELCSSVDSLAKEFGIQATEELAKIALIRELWNQVADLIHAFFPNAAIENSACPAEQNRRLVIFFQPEARCGFGIAWHGRQFNELYWGVFRRHEWHDTSDIASKLAILFDGQQPTAYCPWWRWASPTDAILPTPINWENDTLPWREILTGSFSQRLVSVAKNFRAIVHDPGIL
jgi:hypothetical protein